MCIIHSTILKKVDLIIFMYASIQSQWFHFFLYDTWFFKLTLRLEIISGLQAFCTFQEISANHKFRIFKTKILICKEFRNSLSQTIPMLSVITHMCRNPTTLLVNTFPLVRHKFPKDWPLLFKLKENDSHLCSEWANCHSFAKTG